MHHAMPSRLLVVKSLESKPLKSRGAWPAQSGISIKRLKPHACSGGNRLNHFLELPTEAFMAQDRATRDSSCVQGKGEQACQTGGGVQEQKEADE